MAKDPYFSYVTLLMHCNDFTDVVTGNTATLVGTPTIDTTVRKFGSGSIKLPPGSYLTFPDDDKWDFGEGAFTVEFWVRVITSSTYYYLLGQYPSGGAFNWNVQTNASNYPYFNFYDGSSRSGPIASNPVDTTWNWFAFQRDDLGRLTVHSQSGWNYYNNFSYTMIGAVTPLTIGPMTGGNGIYIDEIRITKGVARYPVTSAFVAPTEPFPDRSYDIFEDAISETSLMLSHPSWGNLDIDGLADYVMVNGVLRPTEFQTVNQPIAISRTVLAPIGRAVSLDQAATAADSTSMLMGAIISDYTRMADSLGVGARYSHAFSELMRALDSIKSGVPVTVEDSVGVAWALSIAQGATVAEKLKISHVLDHPVILNYSVTDAIGFYDTLARFLHYDLLETVTVQDTMAALARHVAAISEAGTLAGTVEPHFILKIEVTDDAIFDDTFDLRMLYRPEVREQIVISALYVAPDGGITSWVVNTRTGAVTEYENFDFNSFCQNGVHYLGATKDGLYILDGEDDAGTPTLAHLRSGFAQFGGSRYTSFKAAYLGIRGDGNIFLKLDTGDGRAYTYRTVVQNQQSTKVRFGKGLRARYFAFELITEGQDFDLDTIEFVPVVAQRRV